MSKLQEHDRQLTAEYYHDPEIYRLECDQIFSRNWLYLTHDTRIPQGNGAVVMQVVNDSVLARRAADHQVRTFHNVCRHRGAPLLASGVHQCDLLRCPYHGWVYSDEGSLVSAPRFNEVSLPAEADRLALWPIMSDQFDRMIFIRLQSEGPPLGKVIEPIMDVVKAYELETRQSDSTFELVFNCNWKVYVENWLESYHLPWLHKGLTKDVMINQYEVEVRERAVCHRSTPVSKTSVYAGSWVWLWPLTAWNSYEGGLSIERIIPDGPDRTIIEFTFFFSPEVGPEQREAARRMADSVTREDGRMCELVHLNLRRGRYSPGPLSPVHELALGYFQHLVRDALHR